MTHVSNFPKLDLKHFDEVVRKVHAEVNRGSAEFADNADATVEGNHEMKKKQRDTAIKRHDTLRQQIRSDYKQASAASGFTRNGPFSPNLCSSLPLSVCVQQASGVVLRAAS